MGGRHIDMERYSIHELAHLTGVTKRNIRYYIVEKLLPPAEDSSPGATYRMTHRLRLEVIREYRSQHYSLQEIREMFEGTTDDDLRRILGREVEEKPKKSLPPSSPQQKRKETPDKQANRPVVFSFFAGIGLMDLGFEEAGFEIVYVNELKKDLLWGHYWARLGLESPAPRFGYFRGSVDECVAGRESLRIKYLIDQLRAENRTIGFIAGPPCQDFSIAGHNAGVRGKEGRLSQTYMDLVSKHQPDFFFYENVQGLLIKHRMFFDSMVEQSELSGYRVGVRLLNALEFGVAQSRKRVFLIGFHRDAKLGHPDDVTWRKYAKYSEGECFDFTWPDVDEVAITRECANVEARDLTVQHWFALNDVESHPNARQTFKPRATDEFLNTVSEGSMEDTTYKRFHRCRFAPTLATGSGGNIPLHPYLPRTISVAEALAIQSMPKTFCLPPDMYRTQMFKGISNGVPFLLASGMAHALHDHIVDQRNNEGEESDHVTYNQQSDLLHDIELHSNGLYAGQEE